MGWRYDEMGDMWLHLFPTIIQAATGHNASYYLDRLHSRLGLSSSFTWSEVNTKWFRGASGSCRDWARFGQLILNKGMWAGQPVISSDLIAQMQQPVKYAPYNSYSNPCYGLLLWVNADKSKTPGCCWEASRLPPPDCNEETFMTGAVHDLTLNIGLYGQLVMTLDSVKTVVVGFGNDLRPIEPARIGYYPGVCKALVFHAIHRHPSQRQDAVRYSHVPASLRSVSVEAVGVTRSQHPVGNSVCTASRTASLAI